MCVKMFSLYSSVADGNTHHTLRANILLQDICKGLPWSSYLGYGLLTLGCDKRWGTMCVQILILTVSICIDKHHCLSTILCGPVTESSSLGFYDSGSSPGDKNVSISSLSKRYFYIFSLSILEQCRGRLVRPTLLAKIYTPIFILKLVRLFLVIVSRVRISDTGL